MPPRTRPIKDDDDRQFTHAAMSREEVDEKYPNRPRNHADTLPFHDLYLSLFNPLNENQKRPTGPVVARAKVGPHGRTRPQPQEVRRNIIERFISRWRQEVGHDFYPALRLIIPEKDRDRPMYGLKEKAIARLIIKLLNLHQDSDDGFNLLNFKLPARGTSGAKAGDFAGRCHAVLSKRPMLQQPGDMRIAEVNELLDHLAGASKEDTQLPIFREFYERMNAEELMWLIRIILRAMKVGATEKTFLNLWHPDGENLFNVSSSLRRVCWELADPTVRLEGDDRGVNIMSCFQPQLAQFQMHNFGKLVATVQQGNLDAKFWIEEKLDGERMQMHGIADDQHKGGFRFAWWSRKGKDYTYLYGDGYEDENSALSRHLRGAFDSRIKSLILDGEMITWDPKLNKMVAFGSLKSAAISEQKNPFGDSPRPLYRVFDCLYVNGEDITRYTLQDRNNVLEKTVTDVHRRIEKHPHEIAEHVDSIEPALRRVVAESSEGLVIKNPGSSYSLNSRNNDWIKVKPEYMTEFGESLDCVIIGGYYGGGRRGDIVASYLCGLRVDEDDIKAGARPEKCLSFFKVGGGFRAEDYAAIEKELGDKWIAWDKAKPPNEYIKLGGGDRQHERPDLWIPADQSIVIESKASSVTASDRYGFQYTLRFPRFKQLRLDKKWSDALSIRGFALKKLRMDQEQGEKKFELDTKRRVTKKIKREIVVAGKESPVDTPYAGPATKVFTGLDFCVLSEMIHPHKKSKAELEQLIKANGGSIFQSHATKNEMIVISDKKVVKAASLIKSGEKNLIKPAWLLDAVRQAEKDGPGRQRFVIPPEPRHLFYTCPDALEAQEFESNVDRYGDSYARDTDAGELESRLGQLAGYTHDTAFDAAAFWDQLDEHGHEPMSSTTTTMSTMFRHCRAAFFPADHGRDGDRAPPPPPSIAEEIARCRFRFAGGALVDMHDDQSTHVVLCGPADASTRALKARLAAQRARQPRVVSLDWIEESWREGTRLDEERFAVT